MIRAFFSVLFLAALLLLPARAVDTGGTSDTTPPTSTDIPNWNTGWGMAGITGWDYVGTVNGAGGVYLGNGWVITAGHVTSGNVGTNTFNLDGTPYPTIPGSDHTITYSLSGTTETADIDIFQIAYGGSTGFTAPNLPNLTLALNDPSDFLDTSVGDNTAIIGYGGGKSWGYDNVTLTNQLTGVYSYVTNDFFTADGTVTNGSTTSAPNNSGLQSGDSGGGDFIYNSATGRWELAGINEAIGGGDLLFNPNTGMWEVDNPPPPPLPTGATNVQSISFSAYEQLDTYAPEISSITGIAIPEPGTWALLGLGLASLGFHSHRRISARR